ncbi:MAG TPA: serine hydrolase domain-containing protein [Chitinophaga sp.]|uniref:serine hydrolase domain-containing protein n=1 Tax=Chitinophaga sp. TaxID=1869181 RepID=UPI002BF7CDF2|nr:serine hydrolase domain-containing protein [Chitinophaga sp.]HVI48086.1 serine hydrolase domain-containing protein [Chitinophaga sp.]
MKALLIFTLWISRSLCSHAACAPDTAGIPQLDEAVRQFMTSYEVPGMTVAVTRNGKLVYCRGYGYADKEKHQRVTPASLFRLASVSKSITAVAILKLAEAGRLSLDDKVFGEGNILGTRYGSHLYSDTLESVTIRHLLQHTAGGWSNAGTRDPMFNYAGYSKDSLISAVIDNEPLINKPGAVYAYSNFGYCLLGRVIEKISGMSYEQYVKANVLAPLGIHDMQIGGNTLADKKDGEVKYYGQHGENPYGFDLVRMDAHGGWVASATDMAKFLAAIDGFSTFPDIISAASIKALTTASTANPSYALGLAVNAYHNWWHVGSLPGTASEIIRSAKGFNWVLLCNTRTDKAFFNDLDGLLWGVVNNPATRWPETDLFY